MDAFQIRRHNLKVLAAARKARGLSQKQTALELNLGASHMSQLIAGSNMGEDVARKIEDALKLPHGWMDRLHDSDHDSSAGFDPSQSLRLDPEIITGSLKLVRLSFEMLGLEHDSEADGTPLAFAYEYLARRNERAVTPENLVDFGRALAKRLKEQQDAEQAQAGVDRGLGGDHRKQG